MLPFVCSVIDHIRRENVVRTSVTHSAIASCATFLFLPHFDVVCDLLLNRRMATWNLFVKKMYKLAKAVLCKNLGHFAATGVGLKPPKAYKSWSQLEETQRYVLQIFNFNDTVLQEGWRKSILYIFLFLCLFS